MIIVKSYESLQCVQHIIITQFFANRYSACMYANLRLPVYWVELLFSEGERSNVESIRDLRVACHKQYTCGNPYTYIVHSMILQLLLKPGNLHHTDRLYAI